MQRIQIRRAWKLCNGVLLYLSIGHDRRYRERLAQHANNVFITIVVLLLERRNDCLYYPPLSRVFSNGCCGPWWGLSSSLSLMEDILRPHSIYTPTVKTHKLNVSGHMLLWTFFLRWYLQLMAQISPHISVTLCSVSSINKVAGVQRRFGSFMLLHPPAKEPQMLTGTSLTICHILNRRLFWRW
jgi:hypothetical protein